MLNTVVKNLEAVSAQPNDGPSRLPRSKMPQLALDAAFYKGPYPQIDFILALNESLGSRLPDLGADSAKNELIKIFHEKNIMPPIQPTLPRLLDKLSATYLEPLCDRPTWIINHPECLSPLSKSFFHPSPSVAQRVAARAELFIRGHEIVNCYEEENSPFEQRRKFTMQQSYANANDSGKANSGAMEIDENYLKALEWGLPPTGGWGCGIDRLVMLLAGKQRINDVLTFGNLKSVTRPFEPREMVRLATPLTAAMIQKTNPCPSSKATEGVTADTPQISHPPDGKIRKPGPQIDVAEEAVIMIKDKLNREKGGHSKQPGQRPASSAAERKNLAIWLAGRGGPDAAEWLLNK